MINILLKVLSWLSRPGSVSEEYRTAVTKLADKGTNQRFLNDSNEHALLVTDLMFNRIDEMEEILIYSKSLKPAFYEKILRHSKHKIKILLDDTAGIDRIKTLPMDIQTRLECRLTGVTESHFILAGRAFRFEINKYLDELCVVCNFNEPKVAQKLRNRFDSLWNSASPCS